MGEEHKPPEDCEVLLSEAKSVTILNHRLLLPPFEGGAPSAAGKRSRSTNATKIP
jgi:hypothetical protein